MLYSSVFSFVLMLICITVARAYTAAARCSNCLYGQDFCDQSKGQCLFGCVPGWKTEQCTHQCTIDKCKECLVAPTTIEECTGCEAGWYGPLCNLRCSSNCRGRGTDDICDHAGRCIYGCTPGYQGNKCDFQYCPFSNCVSCTMMSSGRMYCSSCKPGHYFNWEEMRCTACSNYCRNGRQDCETDGGRCRYGCKDEWFGDLCDHHCTINNCKVCTQQSKNTLCALCTSGFYPAADSISCLPCDGNCVGTCDGRTGDCLDCEKGWYGDKCDNKCTISHCAKCSLLHIGATVCDECEDGSYFSDMNMMDHCEPCPTVCANGTEVCHKLSGNCMHGCQPSRYGKHCQYTCSKHCIGSTCDSGNGHCQCEEGWYGLTCGRPCPSGCSTCDNFTNGRCQLCQPGSWGSMCENTCEQTCLRNQYSGYIYCNQDTGTCDEGCMPGFHGSHCNVSCGEHCDGNVCDEATGHCMAGCTPYWYGDTCSSKCSKTCTVILTSGVTRPCHMSTGVCLHGCVDGFYDDYCTETCGQFCRGNACYQSNGKCHNGCEYGYMGPYCNKSCGHDCPNQCSENCLNGICDETNACVNGCKPGFYGSMCQEQCSATCLSGTCVQSTGACSVGCVSRHYGAECRWPCPENCEEESCDRSAGTCHSCLPGYHGVVCDNPCPANCNNGTCQLDTGQCHRCTAGWGGNFCSEVCRPGSYGESCDQSCGHCKDSSPCFILNGWCHSGCEYGWTGPKCMEAAVASLQSASKDNNVSLTVGSSVAAVLFVALVIIGVVMAYRRNRLAKSPKTTTPEPAAVVYSASTGTAAITLQVSGSTSLHRVSSDISVHNVHSALLGDVEMANIKLNQPVMEGGDYTLYTGTVVHHGDTRAACIKLMQIKAGNSETSYKTWLSREADFLSTCGPHPNIVSIFTTHTNDDVYCTVLDSCLQSGILPYLTSLPAADTNVHQLLQFTIDVAAAMSHLHTCKIIHRHIIGSSVYVTENLIAKLGDFDWAVYDTSHEDLTEETPMHVLPEACGRWMAPECFLKDEYTYQTDVWSAGVFVWEVFTCGLQPFAGTDLATVRQTVIDGVRPAKPNLAHISLYRVMKNCWRYSPEDRPSAGQLLHQLHDIQARDSPDVSTIVVQV